MGGVEGALGGEMVEVVGVEEEDAPDEKGESHDTYSLGSWYEAGEDLKRHSRLVLTKKH